MPFSRNLNVPIAALVAAVALATPAVASDTARAASSSGTEELETVVADTLTALGVDTDVVDALTDAAVREASERLGTLRDGGSFTDDQLATLTKRTRDGTLYEQIAASIGDIRTRLAAVRDAAEARLAEIGAHLDSLIDEIPRLVDEPGQSPRPMDSMEDVLRLDAALAELHNLL